MWSTHLNHRRSARLSRNWLAAALAALLLLAACGSASGADDELPSGRLGYRWTPTPPSQPTSGPDQRTIDAVKYGGGAVLVLWILRKLTRAD